jgi:splicing factor 3A subunit 3
MLLEDQRLLHEDLERLEDATAERLLEDPKHVSAPSPSLHLLLTVLLIRERLARDHEINEFLARIEHQSDRLLKIYEDVDGEKDREARDISTGDTMDSFLKQMASIKDHYHRYPNEPVENLEKAYKHRTPEDQARAVARTESLFTGEEGFGRFFDLTMLHEQYLNLPIHQQARRVTYLQYLDSFDNFNQSQGTISRSNKLQNSYLQYLKALQEYLESFMRRTKPLENLDKLFASFDKEFDELWEKDEVPGWEKETPKAAVPEEGPTGDGIWCTACKKSFKTEAVYEGHLSGRKHKKAQAQPSAGGSDDAAPTVIGATAAHRFKERAIAEKEFRIKKLAAAMQTERSDTRVNVERKQGMTDRERQQELEMLFSESTDTGAAKDDEGHESDGEDKIYNPLKLPLAWDGKPIPVWLYRLHGLGVEFPCEICGNFVYMGRRAFDKHFNEPRHVYGLKCLGITGNTSLFREITGIEEATNLWKKIQQDKKKDKVEADNVVQMEDSEGNVMPEKIYNDLLAQGIL